MKTKFIEKLIGAVSIIKDFIAIIPVVVVLLGYLQIHVYYAFFDIPVYIFIDASEVIFAFIPVVFEFIPAALLLFTVVFAMYMRDETPDSGDRFPKIGMAVFVLSLIIGLIIIPLYWVKKFTLLTFFLKHGLVFFLSLPIVFVPLMLAVFGASLISSNIRHVSVVLLLSSLVFFGSYLLIKNYITYRVIEYGGYDGEEKFPLDDEYTIRLSNGATLVTNDSIKFIGKTRNYYFIRNVNSRTNTYLPSAQVIEFVHRDLKPKQTW